MQHLASRQSLGASTETLLSIAATLDDTGLRTLGEELKSVADLFNRELGIRRALSDSSVDAESKTALAQRLLGGRIGDPARRVLDKVVRENWSTGRDLTDALGRLSRTAMFLRAERSGELDNVEDEIFRFGRIISGNPDLSNALDDKQGTPEARTNLVDRLLANKVHPLTVEMLMALASDPGGRSFSYGVDQLVAEAAQRKDKVVAVVTSAVPLTDDQSARLNAALVRIYRRPVVVHVEVEPGLQGGLLVKVGDEVIDGSVAGRIAEIRSRLAG
ncbi:F0F1 ATP synthase subunit delta [Nakamurella deserti]|uniref:F0F1 ATP synthase subunit delta n=1 Tax=Nakamurella deserti TaxID=2164074 RepID=UPI000DBE2E49|nr:F0F1 ATP synthase subunit delta [Nakamurella deserti]